MEPEYDPDEDENEGLDPNIPDTAINTGNPYPQYEDGTQRIGNSFANALDGTGLDIYIAPFGKDWSVTIEDPEIVLRFTITNGKIEEFLGNPTYFRTRMLAELNFARESNGLSQIYQPYNEYY